MYCANLNEVEEFVLCCQCDARGRLGLEDRPYPQADFVREAMRRVRQIRASDLPAHLDGCSIGEALVNARIEAIQDFKRSLPKAQPMPVPTSCVITRRLTSLVKGLVQRLWGARLSALIRPA